VITGSLLVCWEVTVTVNGPCGPWVTEPVRLSETRTCTGLAPSWLAVGVQLTSPELGSIVIPAGYVFSE
jgi:hypothetical protein